MSDTWNPERGDSTRDNADRTGVDRGRERMSDEDFGPDTVPLSAAEHVDTGLTDQDTTAMDQHPTTTEERIRGIIEQSRDDMIGHDREQVTELLRDRFSDAGIEIPDDELESIARGIARDSEELPEGTYEGYRQQGDAM